MLPPDVLGDWPQFWLGPGNPRFLWLDAVHGVLGEEAEDADSETQALDRSSADGEATAQDRVLALYGLQSVHVVVPVDVEVGHSRVRSQDVPLELGEGGDVNPC